MQRNLFWRNVRVASLAMMLVLMLSGLALARDDDDDYYRGNSGQAHQYGYQQGYSDGVRHGRSDSGRRYDLNSEDWEHASRGYSRWMGPFNLYQDGYRDGYRQGYESANRRNVSWGVWGSGD